MKVPAQIIVYILGSACLFGACTRPNQTGAWVGSGKDLTTVPVSPAQNGEGRGGGKGVLCKNGGHESVQLLDIFEAQTLYGLEFAAAPSSEKEGLDLFVKLLAPYRNRPDRPLSEQRLVMKNKFNQLLHQQLRFISQEKVLAPTQDSYEAVQLQECQVVQVADFYDESVLLVDENLWDKMDWLNKTALIAHEYLYQQDRLINTATNSIAVRKTIGHMFSKSGLSAIYAGVATSTKVLSCQTSTSAKAITEFFIFLATEKIYDDQPPLIGARAVFGRLNGHLPFFNTSVFFNGITAQDLADMLQSSDKIRGVLTSSSQGDLKIETYPESKLALRLKLTANQSLVAIQLSGIDSSGTIWNADQIQCGPVESPKGTGD